MDQSVIENEILHIFKFFSTSNEVLFVWRFELFSFSCWYIYIYIIYAYNEDSVSVSKNKFEISNAKREIYVYVVWEIV